MARRQERRGPGRGGATADATSCFITAPADTRASSDESKAACAKAAAGADSSLSSVNTEGPESSSEPPHPNAATASSRNTSAYRYFIGRNHITASRMPTSAIPPITSVLIDVGGGRKVPCAQNRAQSLTSDHACSILPVSGAGANRAERVTGRVTDRQHLIWVMPAKGLG